MAATVWDEALRLYRAAASWAGLTIALLAVGYFTGTGGLW